MPEGDAVWRTARKLDAALSGDVLTTVDLRWPRLATVRLTDRRVLETVSAGKHLLTRLAGDERRPAVTIHSHLRMDGSWQTWPVGRRAVPGPRSRARAVLATAEKVAVGYSLGMLDVLLTADEHRVVGHLGPDILGPGWNADEALRRLLEAPGRPIGEALLDQRNLAGIGTMHASEALHRHRLSPWVSTGRAANLADLVAELPERLRIGTLPERAPARTREEILRERSASDPLPVAAVVYGHAGRACPRCGSTIRRGDVGSGVTVRQLFFCPGCQR